MSDLYRVDRFGNHRLRSRYRWALWTFVLGLLLGAVLASMF
ncbi:hypothetical protein [Stagnimonas aquatica]|nr:hypothetical protein [Stagnimonas aquatica]